MRKRRDSDARLIGKLRAVRDEPPEALEHLSFETRTPLHRLHGLSTFYPHLRASASGAIRVCTDLSCHLTEPTLIDELAASGRPVQPCSCLGLCDRPGAAAVDGGTVGDLSAAALVDPGRLAPADEAPATRNFHVDCIDPGHPVPYAALRRVVAAADPAWVVRELEQSGLRGFGGAGFPTARKWELVRRAQATEKFVIANADESEPGTFKDRFLLERFSDLVVEGVLIAALTVGARQAYVFLRHEYASQRPVLQHAIDKARAAGAAGDSLFGSSQAVAVEIFDSPGGYICGEETALLEAMEGKRAEPRNRPPFPGTQGLWGQPTLINNIETLAWVPAILARGGSWFATAGYQGRAGRKMIALSGHVERPGVYEIPLGLPARALIEEHGGGVSAGRRLKAFAPGGASSGFLPASQVDVALDFADLAAAGSMLGSGSFLSLDEGTCMVDAALNVLRFFRNESCGKCVPCRIGSDKLVHLTERLARHGAPDTDLAVVDELAAAMAATSICGLGQAAPNPLTSVLRHFPAEVEAHRHGRCPEGACR